MKIHNSRLIYAILKEEPSGSHRKIPMIGKVITITVLKKKNILQGDNTKNWQGNEEAWC